MGLAPDLEAYDLLLTGGRWFGGLVAGCFLALVWTLLAYPTSRRRVIVAPLLDFSRSLPVLALLPFIQYFFGVSEVGKLLLISLVTSFPIWLSVDSRLRGSDRELQRTVRIWSNVRRLPFRDYYLPVIFDGLATGIAVSVGLGWLVVVAAEMIGTYSTGPFAGGLGTKLFIAVARSRLDLALLDLCLFGLLGLGSSFLWRMCLSKILRPRLRIYEF